MDAGSFHCTVYFSGKHILHGHSSIQLSQYSYPTDSAGIIKSLLLGVLAVYISPEQTCWQRPIFINIRTYATQHTIWILCSTRKILYVHMCVNVIIGLMSHYEF